MIQRLLILLIILLSVKSSEAQCRLPSHKYIGDLCYILPDQLLNFQDARNFCHQTATELAVIHTSSQASFLATLMGKQISNSLFWIGLSRESVNSPFQWDDGTNMYFSNFDSNFPKDNLYVAESTVNGKWRTSDGQRSLNFVCSYDPNVIPCTPQSNSTFLFAYSNDLDAQVVRDSIDEIESFDVYGYYAKFGTIRFDTTDPGDFQFSMISSGSLTKSVYSNLPDKSLGFSNDQIGSDILNVLQRFLDNTDMAPSCGAKIIILLKRHPLETDYSKLLSQLQKNHVFIRTVMSNTPILGENYQVMYNLSGLTNGLASFVDKRDIYYLTGFFCSVLYNPFQFYSVNPIVTSGIERSDFPLFQVPPSRYSSVTLWLEFSYQDHGPLDKFRSFNLTLTNTMDSSDQNNCFFKDTITKSTYNYCYAPFRQNSTYSINLLTQYSDSVPENLQIRIWSDFYAPIDHWVPFSNWN